ncbi:hypothetical protein N5E02_06485 [Stenotrophomonas sp. GD03777]|uniref:hypothetical protein n=1 Tax=Stenotrophomonas TaxID=40323 RepID=UPI001FA8031C|nr:MULTISPECIES: hypothetical protein [Stenotrophomonas]MDH1661059.1 hypothetical protein [Stenotrophomonas sp. GD03777]
MQQGDKLGVISTAVDVQPGKDDRLLLGGQLYHLIDLQPLSPGGQILLYEFHTRRRCPTFWGSAWSVASLPRTCRSNSGPRPSQT